MHEGPPIHREEQPQVGVWDPIALKVPLGAHPHETKDLFFGDGAAFRLGPDRSTHLAIYPEHQAVEVTTPDVVLTLRRPAELTIVDDGVVFEAHTPEALVSLAIGRDGSTVFSRVPILEEPDPDRAEPSKITMAASVVNEPRIGETDEGHPIVRFAVVTGSNGDERFHNVYSTKRHAERIAEKDLHRGDPITLHGTVHRFGDEETIYAYGVRKTNGASEQHP
jgi:hypothetical protein